MREKQKITVIVPTFNVENLIENTLKSILWADEILVVDSFSTDRTVEIAQELGARVIQHEYVYSAKQKNWVIPQAKNNWIFLVDSDEIVTQELKKSIQEVLKSKDLDKYDGFGIARRHYFLGKFLRFGGRYPLYNIRLFRKTCRYEDRDVHAHIILEKNKVKNLKGDMLHLSDRTIFQFMEKFNRYSTYQANYMNKVYEKGIQIDWIKFLTNYFYFKATVKDIWNFLPGAPFLRFFYMYFFRLGFLDGRHGFLIATFYSLQDYVAKTKYLEKHRKNTRIRIYFQQVVLRRLYSQV